MRIYILFFLSTFLLGCQDVHEEYYPNGTIKSVSELENNVRNGKYEEFDMEGNIISKGVYKDGKKHGIFFKYYKNGNVKYRLRYENGEKDGIITQYFKNGVIQDSGHFVNDKQHGTLFTYFKDGSIDRIQEWNNDTLNGEFESYYQNGQIMMNAEYKMGTVTYYVEYDSLGNVIDEYSDCSNIDLSNAQGYKPKVIIPNKDYLTIDSLETVSISIDNVPSTCFTVNVSNASIKKTGYNEYKVKAQNSPDKKVEFVFSIISNSQRYSLGMIEIDTKLN